MDDVSLGYRIASAVIVVVVAGLWATLEGVKAPWLLCAFVVVVLAPSDRIRGGTTAGAIADGVYVGLFGGVVASAAFGAAPVGSVLVGAALGLVVLAVELWRIRAAR